MDCYIYAVEKSLDSYKFNLLQNKQVFINQLKSRNLAARTIDEGAIDENGGGNFSEYVAILSGNDDLLEKAKLDKKLAVLESERQAYHRNKGNAKGKLNEKTAGIEKNNIFIGRFTRDWEYLNKVAPVDAETGLRPNPLKLDGVDSDNIEILGNRLAIINQKARTEDDYMKIGTLFDFRILVRTEKTCDGDTQALHNKFMVEGLDGIKYTYHNGYIAKDPKLAVMYFINALERILGMIEKYNKKYRTKEVLFNCEMIPAENVGVKHAKWDKEAGFQTYRECYNSYFYIVEDKSLNIVDKFRLHGHRYIEHLTGGSALHMNLEEHLSKEQYRQLLRVAATEGCNYFTFNIPNTVCNKCHHIDKRYLHECPECHSENVDYLTRVIGYMKRISNFSQARQKEADLRYYAPVR